MNKESFARVALLGILVISLGVAVLKSIGVFDSKSAGGAPAFSGSVAKVRLLTGSAKFEFLNDPQVVKILADNGLQVEMTKTGAFEDDVSKAAVVDAVWPAGAAAAADFSRAWKAPDTYQVFSTPLAIASWKQLLPVLEKNGMVKKDTNVGGLTFSLEKALPLMQAGRRWNQLSDNSAFAVNRGFLINTPDVRKTATASLYVSLLAYIQNGNEVPTDANRARALTEALSGVITRQGFQESTLSGPFEDYLSVGMGKAPLVLVYESQFVEAKQAGKLRDNHVLLYPEPGLVLKHVLVARTEAGKRLGELLANNPELQQLAAKHGFRTNNAQVFSDAMAKIDLKAPDLLNLAEAPSTMVLDAINQTLTKKLEGGQ